MNNQLVSLFFGAGVAGWVYYQVMRRTGSNAKAAWGSAAFAGLIAYFVFYSLFAWVFKV